MSYTSTTLPDLHRMRVAEMDWLTSDLAIGGDLAHDRANAIGQVRWLEHQGVNDIIGCREEYNDESLVADMSPGIRYHHLPTDDHGGRLGPGWWDRGISIARDVVELGGAVFAHCHMGVNRGRSPALAILLDRGMDEVAAFDLLRARRPQAYAIYARPNPTVATDSPSKHAARNRHPIHPPKAGSAIATIRARTRPSGSWRT